jgi:hypothetical protein
MIEDMRTTVDIPESLLRQAKALANERGERLSDVVTDSLRVTLNGKGAKPAKEPFRIEPIGTGGLRPGVDLSSNAKMWDLLDEGVPLDKLR